MRLLTPDVVPEAAREIKADARTFAEEHLLPNAAEHFESGAYPHDLAQKAIDAGLACQGIDEAYGGRGLSAAQQLAIDEEFFRADAGLGLAIQGRTFGAKILERYGTEAQKEEYLPPLTTGEAFTGMAISEPETGSDMAGMRTRAERDGDEWVLNGEKYWIGNGIDADWITVYARTDDGEDRYGNHSLFVVPTDAPGYEAEHIPEKIGMRASQQAHIVLDDCRIPAENLIGEEGDGFRMVAEFFNTGRVMVGAQAVGLAAAAIEEAWEFVHGREEFGRTVNEFQSVQHDLADMRTEFESARSLVWRAAEKLDGDDDASAWAAMAKVKGTETAVDCAETAMSLHGGRSVLNERRISRIYRDVRHPIVYEGVNEIQRDLIYRNF